MSEANKRQASGRVVSDRMKKTVTVLVERRVRHPLYGKIITRSRKYHAHDEAGECKAGDLVLIEECRPLSKTKAWRVVRTLEKARIV
ncbi:MAG TPA: 30S ribosomal protein S17 [Burkholderiales bacterium]|jgi:small subunit ribosomal protein S17|nr:30S ribosomal protein S17 [Burkholderiales bacterium]